MGRELPYAPWAVPKEKHLGSGVYVTEVYGWHVLNAFLYLVWRKLTTTEGNDDHD